MNKEIVVISTGRRNGINVFYEWLTPFWIFEMPSLKLLPPNAIIGFRKWWYWREVETVAWTFVGITWGVEIVLFCILITTSWTLYVGIPLYKFQYYQVILPLICIFIYIDVNSCSSVKFEVYLLSRFHCACICYVRVKSSTQLWLGSLPIIYRWRHHRLQGWLTWNCQEEWNSSELVICSFIEKFCMILYFGCNSDLSFALSVWKQLCI